VTGARATVRIPAAPPRIRVMARAIAAWLPAVTALAWALLMPERPGPDAGAAAT
jgi:hypothetical protein